LLLHAPIKEERKRTHTVQFTLAGIISAVCIAVCSAIAVRIAAAALVVVVVLSAPAAATPAMHKSQYREHKI
jgi:hypothetical protein